MLKAILGGAALGLSIYEMWKANKPVLGNLQLDEESEEQVNDVGVVQGSPGPAGGFMPVLGPVQGIQPSGGGMGPDSGGRWVPTHPYPPSGGGGRIVYDGGGWGVSGWGWPYYGYPYYPYAYPQAPQNQDIVCRQSDVDPKEFICHQQYPQYRQRRAYAWGPPNWGWY